MNDLFPITDDELDALLDHHGELDLPEHAWPANLLKLVVVWADMWARRGVPEEEAARRAKEAAITLARYLGGTQMYMPTGESLDEAVRDALIFREYRCKPFNAEEVARKHGLVPDRARAIYKKQCDLYRARVQPFLPGMPAPPNKR